MKTVILIVIFLLISIDSFAIENSNYLIVKNALINNITVVDHKSYLSAGGNQFKSFWTRDFGFSSEALMKIGKEEVVKNQIEFLLDHLDKTNLVPLYVDSKSPIIRVIESSTCRLLKCTPDRSVKNKIKSFYLVNGKFRPIDSNLTLLLAISNYIKFGNHYDWYEKNIFKIKKVFHYYDDLKDDGLVVQDEHADWQDSAKRNGKTFFTNILYYQVARDLNLITNDELRLLKLKITSNFFDTKSKLFFSVLNKNYISLDGILWGLDNDFFENPEVVYKSLKESALFYKNNGPGFATYPSYEQSELYLQVKLVGLREYHGNLYWSWLLGKTAKVAKKFNDIDLFNSIDMQLNSILNRDKTVYEIYENSEDHLPFKTAFYESESPFSWGAASIIEYN